MKNNTTAKSFISSTGNDENSINESEEGSTFIKEQQRKTSFIDKIDKNELKLPSPDKRKPKITNSSNHLQLFKRDSIFHTKANSNKQPLEVNKSTESNNVFADLKGLPEFKFAFKSNFIKTISPNKKRKIIKYCASDEEEVVEEDNSKVIEIDYMYQFLNDNEFMNAYKKKYFTDFTVTSQSFSYKINKIYTMLELQALMNSYLDKLGPGELNELRRLLNILNNKVSTAEENEKLEYSKRNEIRSNQFFFESEVKIKKKVNKNQIITKRVPIIEKISSPVRLKNKITKRDSFQITSNIILTRKFNHEKFSYSNSEVCINNTNPYIIHTNGEYERLPKPKYEKSYEGYICRINDMHRESYFSSQGNNHICINSKINKNNNILPKNKDNSFQLIDESSLYMSQSAKEEFNKKLDLVIYNDNIDKNKANPQSVKFKQEYSPKKMKVLKNLKLIANPLQESFNYSNQRLNIKKEIKQIQSTHKNSMNAEIEEENSDEEDDSKTKPQFKNSLNNLRLSPLKNIIKTNEKTINLDSISSIEETDHYNTIYTERLKRRIDNFNITNDVSDPSISTNIKLNKQFKTTKQDLSKMINDPYNKKLGFLYKPRIKNENHPIDMSVITKPNTTRSNKSNNTEFIYLYPLNELPTKPDKIKKLINLKKNNY